MAGMARWEPGARDRLRRAAIALYLERGFEHVTVAEIAARAGLTRRTFFRYFPDKREVLFVDADLLPDMLAEAVLATDRALPPLDMVLQALAVLGTAMAEHAQQTRERRAVIATSHELQERERTKTAALTTALADVLRQRDIAASRSALLAQVGIAIFQSAFDRWTDRDGRADFQSCFREAATELRSTVAAAQPLGSP